MNVVVLVDVAAEMVALQYLDKIINVKSFQSDFRLEAKSLFYGVVV
ncbi:MAG: hypothetical protein ACOCWG_04300 [bacterium]